MKIMFLALAFASHFISHSSVSQTTLTDANQILRQSEMYRGFQDSFTMLVRIDNYNGTEKSDTSTFRVSIKDNSTSLAEQTEPPKAKGRKLLMIDNDMWLHTPDIKKAIRISLEQKLTGETANGDIAKTNFYGDYEPKVLETTETQIKLQLDAKSTGTTYKQIIYYLDAKSFVPQKAEFLAASGKILKTASYGKLKIFGGKKLITEVEIVDGLQKKRKSKILYGKFKKEKIDDSVFNRSSL